MLVQATDYYPFGKSFDNVNVAQNRYLYNGKELQDQAIGGTPFGWYDYGARFYDPELGRWHSMDPKAENFSGLSPYAYCANNPILLDDPNGEDWSIPAWKDKSGKLHINITVNAAVLNSSGKNINMSNYVKNEQRNFSNIFSMNRKNFDITAILNMRSVDSKDDVKGSEHLIEIQKPEEFDDNVAGSSQVGGLNVRMNSEFINEDA